MTFSGNTGILDSTGAVNKATFKSQFLVPTKNDIEALQTTVAMTGPQFTAADVNGTATALVAFGGQTKPMSLNEVIRVSGVVRPYYSAQDFGMVGDGVTDDSPAFQRGLDTVAAAGGGLIILRADPGKAFYLKGSPRGASNVSISCASPFAFTRSARMMMAGSYAFDPAASSLALSSNASSGGTTLPINTASGSGAALTSMFSVGDLAYVTGLLDSCGTPLEEQLVRITAVSDSPAQLTTAQTLNFAFQSTYTAGDYETAQGVPNRTRVSRVITVDAAADVAVGSTKWTIGAGQVGVLNEGDYVLAWDESTCADVAGTDTTQTKIQPVRVAANVSGDASTDLRVSHTLERSYTTAKKAKLIKFVPIENASVEGATAIFTQAPDAVVHTFEGRFAVDCIWENCSVLNEDNFGSQGNGCRFIYSYSSRIRGFDFRRAKYVASGQGNGAVLAWSTDCHIEDCNISGARHAVQFLGATNCTAEHVTAQNPRHTPFDCHGANEVGCLFIDCTATGGVNYQASPGKSPSAITFGNPTLTGGAYRCGFIGGRIRGFKDPSGSSHEGCIKFFPGSSTCFVRGTEFNDIGMMLYHEDTSGLGTLVSSGHRLEGLSVDGCASWLGDLQGRTNGASVNTLSDFQVTNCTFRNIVRMFRAAYVTELQLFDNVFDEITPEDANPYVVYATNVTGLTYVGNKVTGSKLAIYLGTTTSVRIDGDKWLDLTATSYIVDAGSNTGTISNQTCLGFIPTFTNSGGSTFTTFPRAPGIITIADDSFYTFIPERKNGTVTVWSNAASTIFAHAVYIAAGTPACALITGANTSNVAVTTGALAGTTGTDTKFTISAHASNGQIYFENRTGSSVTVDYSLG